MQARNAGHRIARAALTAALLACALCVAGGLCGGICQQAHAAKVTSAKVAVKGVSKTYAYTGKKIKPKPALTYKGRLLKRGRDYTLSYSANKAVGTARIVISGTGSYSGQRVKTFKIRYSLSKKGSISLARSSLPYTGSARKPYATVKYKGKALSKGVDYTLKYTKNKKVGTAKVTATGTGRYAFKVSKSFKITAAGGKIVDLSEHNGAASAFNWTKVARRVDAAILRSYVTFTASGHAHKKVGDGQWRADYRYGEYATACEKRKIPYAAYGYLVYKGNLANAKLDAAQQAEEFWKASFSGGHKPLYLVLDIEDGGMASLGTNVAACVGVAADRLQQLARAAGYKKGIKVGLYVGNHVYSSFGFTSTAGAKVLKDQIDFVWIPSYGKNTGSVPASKYRPDYPYDAWQYSSNAKVAGIPGAVDASRIVTTGPNKHNMGWYCKR